MTQDDAVAKALKMNIELSVERLNPQLQDLALKGAFAAYVPTVRGTLGERSNTTRPGNIFSGGEAASRQHHDRRRYNANATQGIRWTGATANINWGNSRQATDNWRPPSTRDTTARLSASVTQPLWRNREIDANRQSLLTAEINRRIADITLRAATVNTIANTRNAYWDSRLRDPGGRVGEDLAGAGPEAGRGQQDPRGDRHAGAARHHLGAGRSRDAPADAGHAEANRRAPELVFKRLIVSGTDDPLWNVTLNPTDRPATDVAEKIDLRPLCARRSRTGPTS